MAPLAGTFLSGTAAVPADGKLLAACLPGDNVTNVVEAVQDDGDGRQRSSIGFPYNNLGDAIEVAQAIHSNLERGIVTIRSSRLG